MELLDQEYQMVPVSKMRPHPENPNIGDEDALAGSIKEVGFFGAVVVRKHPDEKKAWQILGGEHRWRHAVRNGVTKLPAIVIADCDDVQAVKILYLDNEVTRRGSYQQDVLDKVLAAIGPIEGFEDVLSAAGAAKDREDEEEAEKHREEASEDGAYHDDDDDEGEFANEYGILVMADSEIDQQAKYEELAKMFGASTLRVVSI